LDLAGALFIPWRSSFLPDLEAFSVCPKIKDKYYFWTWLLILARLEGLFRSLQLMELRRCQT